MASPRDELQRWLDAKDRVKDGLLEQPKKQRRRRGTKKHPKGIREPTHLDLDARYPIAQLEVWAKEYSSDWMGCTRDELFDLCTHFLGELRKRRGGRCKYGCPCPWGLPGKVAVNTRSGLVRCWPPVVVHPDDEYGPTLVGEVPDVSGMPNSECKRPETNLLALLAHCEKTSLEVAWHRIAQALKEIRAEHARLRDAAGT